MNWAKWIMAILQLAPLVVMGVEKIHKGAPGATKQEIATQSLLLASGVAAAVDPDDSETIAAASTVAKAIIDSTVAEKNRVGEFTKAPKVKDAPAKSGAVKAPGLHNTVAQ